MISTTPTDEWEHLQDTGEQDEVSANPRKQKGLKSREYRMLPKQKKKKDIISNPLQQGIRQFLHKYYSERNISSDSQSPPGDTAAVISGLPKRYTIYHPLLLLPVNAFTNPQPWAEIYESLSDSHRQELYASIATSFSNQGVTHIAINAPILLTNIGGTENRMRSPTCLVPLYGDFGQEISLSTDSRQEGSAAGTVEDHFKNAFWVQATQNGGIVQCWAPLYTMFSRGNITEKARILGLEGRFTGLDMDSLQQKGGQKVGDIGVVDLYAGIGYFVFSYLKRGVKRVWGWELNPWSVEGLRRGCVENGWKCRVVPLDNSDQYGEQASSVLESDRRITSIVDKLLEELQDDDRVVVFRGDNQTAPAIIQRLQPALERKGIWAPIRHVNLGLLPTSRPTWETSLRLLSRECGGWAHVHENVDVAEIERKKVDIVAEYAHLAARLNGIEKGYQGRGLQHLVTCDHVERVKTYAPGVMHVVYDIEVDFQTDTA